MLLIMRSTALVLALAAVLAVVGTACATGSGPTADPAPGGATSAAPSSAALTTAAPTTGSADEDGTGFLTVADLAAPAQPGHFTGRPVPVRARLAVTSTGCVTVTVDGVTRMPIWPAGTRVEDDPADPGHYTVTIPGGPTLKASGATGDTFDARGVIDDEGRPFDAGGTAPDNKVSGLLGFCAVQAAPIAFPDGSTVTRSAT
jgi:hypothetical protein